jgi:glutamyl-tRNA reductase
MRDDGRTDRPPVSRKRAFLLSHRTAGGALGRVSQLVQVGVSHMTAPLPWRERLAIDGQAVGSVSAGLARSAAAREALVLATCSRVEAYLVGPDASRLELELLDGLARRAGCPVEDLATVVDVRRGTDAARHLLRTASGLESPVLGEPEILGQLRRAHRSAAAAAATGPELEQLVSHATRAGRRVRSETGLATGSASLTSTVAGLARTLVGNPGGRRAHVIGRTRTARAAAERLRADGWSVTTASVTLQGDPPPAFDVVVACTGGGAAIAPETLRATARERTGAPLLVVDLSVPRDVDPGARGLPGVLLYDVDDVAVAARDALAARRAHVPAAEAIVEEELHGFAGWRATRALAPTIKALRERQRRAVRAVLGELPDDVAKRLVTRLLHAPTTRLRAAAAAGDGEQLTRTARELFGLGDDEALRAGRPGRPRAAGAAR